MSSAETWAVTAIGTVTSSRSEAIDDDWAEVTATITLAPPLDARSLAGLEEFSHVEVVFLFDRVDADDVCVHSRHPRGNPDWPEVGIFAQRAKDRPNRIGLCTCELVAVDGASLVVRGLDAIDGTPVLDVKPYMLEFAPRGEGRQPAWSHELMRGYW
jgi:tRNA-Thr(GGU) m(6)t(6)A37 methyltransferase TsaA